MSKHVRKTLLTLSHKEYLQFFTSSTMLFFTFLIGIAIGLLTDQISYRNHPSFWPLIMFSALFVLTLFIISLYFYVRLKRIPRKIKKLAH